MIQTFSINKVHNGIYNSVVLNKIIYLGNIGLAQAFQHVHFPPENPGIGVECPFVRFQYDLFVQPQMASQVDYTASSGADLLLYLIHACNYPGHGIHLLSLRLFTSGACRTPLPAFS